MRFLLLHAAPARSLSAFVFRALPFLFALLSGEAAFGQSAEAEVQIVWQQEEKTHSLPDSLSRIPVSQKELARLTEAGASPGEWLEAHEINISRQLRFIRERLAAEGYMRAEVSRITLDSAGDAITLLLHARPGPAYTLRFWERYLEISADSLAAHEQHIRAFKKELSAVSGPYRKAGIEREVQQYLSFWEQRGHLFARIEMDSLQVYDDTREVGLFSRVLPGPEVRLDRQLFPDIRRNNPDFLARITELESGELLTPEKLRQARLLLENTGLFREVATPALVQENGRFHLLFELDERRTNAFDLLVGYVPENDGSGNTLLGNGELMLRNVFLPGSQLDIRFERLQQFVTRLDMGYEATYIGATPFGAGFRFRFEQQDSTYQTREARLYARYRLSSSTALLASLRQRISRAGQLRGSAALRALNAATFFSGFGIEYRQLDRLENPARGVVAELMAEAGTKRIDDERVDGFTENTRWQQQLVTLSLKGYLNPFRRQVIAPRLRGYLMLSPHYTETDLKRFGGARSLRGYREEQFQASRMLWGDLEYRYLLDRLSYGFIFAATGYYERPALVFDRPMRTPSLTVTQTQAPASFPPASQTELLYSYGFGFSYATPAGVIRFSYALSPNDSFANGNVHVGIQAVL